MDTTQKTDNEIIAEFMGGHPENNAHWPGYYFFEQINNSNWWHTPDLAYDTSWDWLMPVVEKIENGLSWKYQVLTENELYLPHITTEYRTLIRDAGDATRFEMSACHTRIESVYKAVVAFINWYNQQVKP
jgi:hypothetical protein